MRIPNSYTKEDLCCVIWENPDRVVFRNARPYETFSVGTSRHTPYAFPIEQIIQVKGKRNCKVLEKYEDLDDLMEGSTKRNPVLIPLKIAEDFLGWQDFEFCHFFNQF